MNHEPQPHENPPNASPVYHDAGYDTIQVVTRVDQLEQVYRLTHDCYVAKEYASPQPNGLLLHYPEFDVVPETTVLIATRQEEVVGSVSYTVRGAEGLTVGHDFDVECKALENEGRTLGAIWRLVVAESCRGSRQVLMALISEAVRRLLMEGVTTCLLVVHPKHAKIYERMLQMRVVARKDGTDGLRNAPAVLLRCDRENLPPAWKLADYAIKMHDPVGFALLDKALAPLIDSQDAFE
jgi:hypothetical protein